MTLLLGFILRYFGCTLKLIKFVKRNVYLAFEFVKLNKFGEVVLMKWKFIWLHKFRGMKINKFGFSSSKK